MGASVKGIYQYDEADDAAPVSTLLNKLGDSVRGSRTPVYSATVTTDANGFATLTHGLGYTPVAVAAWVSGNATGGAAIPTQIAVGVANATSVGLRIFNQSGAAIASSSVAILWTAMGA